MESHFKHFTDAEEEFYLQLHFFLIKVLDMNENPVRRFEDFLSLWAQFLESFPELNATNYPNTEKAIREILKRAPQVKEDVIWFRTKLFEFQRKNFTDFGFGFKNRLRERQYQSSVIKVSEKSGKNEAVLKSDPIIEKFMHRTCACGQETDEHSSLCSGCRIQRYCSQECQRRDWGRHKPECRALSEENAGMHTGLRKKKRTCTYCGEANEDLKECMACHKAWYCNKACQTADWKAGHKNACKKAGGRRTRRIRKTRKI